MIKLQNLLVPVDRDEKTLPKIVAKRLKLKPDELIACSVLRRSVDVRDKRVPCFCYTCLLKFENAQTEQAVLKANKNASVYTEIPYEWNRVTRKPALPPVVVGSGPAGLFAAYTLCKAGMPPIIIEQGEPVEQRVTSVQGFWNGGRLNPRSNVQFGEGGAGTFSDGKLNTGIKDKRCRTVLELFHQFGADADILVQAKPHIGTDVLRRVVQNIRHEIESMGGSYRFYTRFINIGVRNEQLTHIMLESDGAEYELPCATLVLATGNAARDTFRSLYNSGLAMESKPFAVGLRIEHLQEMLNCAQYGNNYNKKLPPSDYKLATHLNSGFGVYSFCMCPGGVVVNGASEAETIVTNGMSYKLRDGLNANAALLVGVSPREFGQCTPLDGISFQEKLEHDAFAATGCSGAPAQTVGSFLGRDSHNRFSLVQPTIMPPAIPTDLKRILPEFIHTSIADAIQQFDRKIHGFADSAAVLTAPETRSSSPVRILRNPNYTASIRGIFPCGEGAGYAGGITSSAVDGIRCAESILALFE